MAREDGRKIEQGKLKKAGDTDRLWGVESGGAWAAGTRRETVGDLRSQFTAYSRMYLLAVYLILLLRTKYFVDTGQINVGTGRGQENLERAKERRKKVSDKGQRK